MWIWDLPITGQQSVIWVEAVRCSIVQFVSTRSNQFGLFWTASLIVFFTEVSDYDRKHWTNFDSIFT